ncbi:hypothetical protein HYQ44_010568, partial [Verticillium longisporum]
MKPAILAVAAGTLLAGSTTAAPVAADPFPAVSSKPNALCNLPRVELAAFQAWLNDVPLTAQPPQTWIACKEKIESREEVKLYGLTPEKTRQSHGKFGRKGTVQDDGSVNLRVVGTVVKNPAGGAPKINPFVDGPRCYSRSVTGQIKQVACAPKQPSGPELNIFKTELVIPKPRGSVGHHKTFVPEEPVYDAPQTQYLPAGGVYEQEAIDTAPQESGPYAPAPPNYNYGEQQDDQYVPDAQFMPVADVPVRSMPQDCYPTASDPNAFTYAKMAQIAQQDVQLPPVIERRGAHPADMDVLYELDRDSARPVPQDLLRHKYESEATEPRNGMVREISTDDEPVAMDEVALAPKMKRGIFDSIAKLYSGRGPKLHAPYCDVWKPWQYSGEQFETKPPFNRVTPEFKKAWQEDGRRQLLRAK